MTNIYFTKYKGTGEKQKDILLTQLSYDMLMYLMEDTRDYTTIRRDSKGRVLYANSPYYEFSFRYEEEDGL